MRRTRSAAIAASLLACTALAPAAEARITKIEITKTEPAFEGKSFGATGAYERLTGKAHGVLDPRSAANRVIQDIELAPRNAQGLVEYTTDIEIIRPKDSAKGNGSLIVEVVNRGNKLALRNHNAGMPADGADLNALKSSGDGFLMNEGYTIVWFGWQADLAAGNNRVRLQAPVAKNPDGSPVTGIVRSEMVVSAPARSLPLSAGWFTATIHTGLSHRLHRQPHAAGGRFPPHADGPRQGERAARRDSGQRMALRHLRGGPAGGRERQGGLPQRRLPAGPAL